MRILKIWLFKIFKKLKKPKKWVFCVSPFIIKCLGVISRTSVPLWELSHLLLTFDGLRAKPTSPEYLYRSFTVSTQQLDPIYLMFFYYWFSTSNSYWEPLVWLVRKHFKKPYWESITFSVNRTPLLYHTMCVTIHSMLCLSYLLY